MQLTENCHNCRKPNMNAMIIEQAKGSTKVTLQLLDKLEPKNTVVA